MERCTQAYHQSLKADPERFRAETDPAYVREDDEERFEGRHCRRCKSTLELATPRDAPLRNPDYPIEVIPEDMDAAAFVYDTLTTMGVSTTKFEAGPAETYGLMVVLVKRGEKQGFDVITKAAPGLTKVFVRKQTRLNASPTRCPKCGKSKYFCECDVRENPPSWVRDEAVWARATARVKPKWKQYREPYAALTDLYFKMGGRKK